MFLLKKTMKYFFSTYLLLHEVCLCGGTVNCSETVFRDTLRLIFQVDFECDSISFHKLRKQAIHQHLDIAHLNI